MVTVRSRSDQRTAAARRYLALTPAVVRDSLAPTMWLIAAVMGVELAMVSIVDDRAHHVVCHSGPDGAIPPSFPRRGVPCTVVVGEERPLVLAETDDFPQAVAERVSYTGVPVIGADGAVIGSLCGLGPVGSTVTSLQLGQWQAWAGVVADQLELLTLQANDGGGTGAGASAREIREGLEAGQFVAWYQSIVDLATGERAGVEALARWHHPDRGLLDPGTFVPVAERSELIVDLDLEMWRQAFDAVALQRQVEPDLRVSVNFSARHTELAEYVTQLTQLASRAGVPPTAVDVEITESARLACGGDLAAHQLGELRDRGFSVLIDDFGTGWATIESALTVPHDGLKVDRAITTTMFTEVGRAVLLGITAGTTMRGIRSIAEGIEGPEQAARAAELGFSHGQGYYWGRPSPLPSGASALSG